jgi:hypothetical protein
MIIDAVALLAEMQPWSASGPKQESTFWPVWEDQRTFAPAMGMGKADGLAGRIKAARVVLG